MASPMFYFLWIFVVIFSLPVSFASEYEPSKPNVVLIVSDDQGWADIGYNNPAVYSPNLDRLAKTGVLFTNSYVMPQCTPTRVALMTGRYPSRFGRAALSASNAPAFPKGTPTIAEMFKRSGYCTFLCGKWHLGSSVDHGPKHFGFDHSYGSLTGAVGMYDHRYRKGKFENTWHRDHQLIEGSENGVHATDLVVQEAIRIVKEKRDQPFFLYVPLHSVHTPLDERGPFIDTPTQLDPNNKKRWLNEDKIEWFNDPQGLIQQELDPEKRLFLAAVNHMDDAIGKLVKAIDDSNQRDNTLIIFSSDNGPQGSWNGNAYPDDLKLTNFNQKLPMRGKKVDVWEGGIHVPAFANWPKKLRPVRFDSPVHIVDWFPTLAHLIGFQADKPIEFDGLNIWDSLSDAQPLPERDLYFNWGNKINRWALRNGQWKIVKYGKTEPASARDWELYNLKNDPLEKHNLNTESNQRPQILDQQHRLFLQHRQRDHKSTTNDNGKTKRAKL